MYPVGLNIRKKNQRLESTQPRLSFQCLEANAEKQKSQIQLPLPYQPTTSM
jgi:hypothetical protein